MPLCTVDLRCSQQTMYNLCFNILYIEGGITVSFFKYVLYKGWHALQVMHPLSPHIVALNKKPPGRSDTFWTNYLLFGLAQRTGSCVVGILQQFQSKYRIYVKFLPYLTRVYPFVLHNTKISLCESVNKFAVIDDNCIQNITGIIILGKIDTNE